MEKKSENNKKDGGGSEEKDYYFDSYSHFGIHEEMLKDEVRTRTYMQSIMQNRHLFKGKVVLDIGCGTGILCMFAAKAGAKKVIGIECAEIYHKAKTIVKANGFEDTIELIKGKVEEIELPVDSVDIIISEWMGYFLLYESMLDTVLYARDKWLVKGGAIFPDKATIHISAIEDQEYRKTKIDYWKSVWGFDMSVVRELALMEPLVDTCDPAQIISDGCKMVDIDIYTVTKEELDFKSKFRLNVSRDDFLHGYVVFFRVEFSKSHKFIGFSTGPMDKYTHWKQTVFYLDNEIPVCKGDSLIGTLSCNRNPKNPRDLDIQLTSTRRSRTHGENKQEKKYRLR